ncbi:MAG: methylated-DNA--[protein]-cysteine S-methyltransferase [Planctomycetes bacterium]|nr:methylated-DNA--[protein]-cysteine S-methyltransferase [Planctomycetota bacterium]MCW8136019.1 methylated-DNA--[protein]-cysteine S-methyltransferase [Planctomycetota bacterium]
MHSQLAIAYVDSPLGELGLAAGEHGLITISMGKGLEQVLPALLKRRRDNGRGRHKPAELLEQACSEVAEYMMSAREKFDTPLDLSTGTEFQRAVWRRLQRVRFGKATTYADLADEIGHPDSARAVGNAVGSNPLPILIPCHRVLAANGRLGGFSGGLARKRKLLAIEGIEYR